jgi:hypothetical protein
MNVQQLQLTLRKDVINGFSYSFSKSLLDKLAELRKEENLYDKDEEDSTPKRMTPLVETICNYLNEQMSAMKWRENFDPAAGLYRDKEKWFKVEAKKYWDRVDIAIANGYSFLAIFEITEVVNSDTNDSLLDVPLVSAIFNLSSRITNVLKAKDITTLRHLTDCTPQKLLKFRGIDKKSLSDIQKVLKKHNLVLADN